RPDVDLNIQISRRATVLAGFAFATQADAIAAIDTRRHLDRQCLTGAHTTFTVAFFAGVAHLASLAMTVRTGLLNGQKTLLNAHLTSALAGWTLVDRRARLRALAS